MASNDFVTFFSEDKTPAEENPEKHEGPGGDKKPVKEKPAKEKHEGPGKDKEDVVEARANMMNMPNNPPIYTSISLRQWHIVTTYWFSWSPKMALRVARDTGNVVPHRLFKHLSTFNVLFPGQPYVPLYRNQSEACLVHIELKALRRNPTLIDDQEQHTALMKKQCSSDSVDEGQGEDICEPEDSMTCSSAARQAKSRGRPSRGLQADSTSNEDLQMALEVASHAATDSMMHYKITFDRTYLLQILLDAKVGVAPQNHRFAPGHLQVHENFRLENILHCQSVEVQQGPPAVKGSAKRAQETFNRGSRNVKEAKKQELRHKREQLEAGIEEERRNIKRSHQVIQDLKDAQELMEKEQSDDGPMNSV